MKKYNPFRKQRVIALTAEEALPKRRAIVFKRRRHRPPPKNWLALLLKALGSVADVFRAPELAREVSPEKPPVVDHDWPKARNRWLL